MTVGAHVSTCWLHPSAVPRRAAIQHRNIATVESATVLRSKWDDLHNSAWCTRLNSCRRLLQERNLHEAAVAEKPRHTSVRCISRQESWVFSPMDIQPYESCIFSPIYAPCRPHAPGTWGKRHAPSKCSMPHAPGTKPGRNGVRNTSMNRIEGSIEGSIARSSLTEEALTGEGSLGSTGGSFSGKGIHQNDQEIGYPPQPMPVEYEVTVTRGIYNRKRMSVAAPAWEDLIEGARIIEGRSTAETAREDLWSILQLLFLSEGEGDEGKAKFIDKGVKGGLMVRGEKEVEGFEEKSVVKGTKGRVTKVEHLSKSSLTKPIVEVFVQEGLVSKLEVLRRSGLSTSFVQIAVRNVPGILKKTAVALDETLEFFADLGISIEALSKDTNLTACLGLDLETNLYPKREFLNALHEGNIREETSRLGTCSQGKINQGEGSIGREGIMSEETISQGHSEGKGIRDNEGIARQGTISHGDINEGKGSIGQVLEKCPRLLLVSLPSLSKNAAALLSVVGREHFPALMRDHPRALTFQADRLTELVSFLEAECRFTPEQWACFFHRLCALPANGSMLPERFEALQAAVGKSCACELILRDPTVLTVQPSIITKNMGNLLKLMDPESAHALAMGKTQVLTMSWDRKIEPAVAYLWETCGISAADVLWSHAFTRSLEEVLKPRVEYILAQGINIVMKKKSSVAKGGVQGRPGLRPRQGAGGVKNLSLSSLARYTRAEICQKFPGYDGN